MWKLGVLWFTYFYTSPNLARAIPKIKFVMLLKLLGAGLVKGGYK